jgi:hypothetical protein
MAIEIQNNALSIIDGVDIQQVAATMQNIAKFQTVIQKTLKQNHDFGIIPGTPKPTLLKPGAEKILMLLGITSEYDILEKVEDYEKEIFAYTVKCTLLKGNLKVTEGIGSCNSKEDKYRYRWVYEDDLPPGADKESLKKKTYGNTVKYKVENDDICSQANTILKMAKKRAQIDATLTVAALSEIFTQDLEDMDIHGNPTENTYNQKVDNPADIVLTFGKFKGKKLGDVPIDYVEWLAKEARDPWMKEAANKLLAQNEVDEFPDEEGMFESYFNDVPSNSDKATESQIKAIYAAANEIGVTNGDVKQWVSDAIKRDFSSMKELTKAEASSVISELNQISKAK